MKNKKYIKKFSDYAMLSGLSAFLIAGLSGCDNKSQNQNNGQSDAFSQASKKQGAFVVIEENTQGQYQIVDEYPSSKTTIILRKPDGSEKILSKEEIDKLVKEEEKKINQGTSPLTNPEMSNGSMGLGGVLLSSIAGAMIGSWIGNKLFNNQNFQNQRKAQYKSPQTYSRSKESFSKARSSSAKKSSSKKSGFFKSKSSKPSKFGSFFGG